MHRHCRAWRLSGERGFTLVELLVALTISSVLAIAAVGALRAGLVLSSRIESVRGAEPQARMIVDTLQAELTGVFFPRGDDGFVFFQQIEDETRGETKTTFCTTMPGMNHGKRPGRCARVTYVFRKQADGAGSVLTRQEEELAGESLVSEPVSEVVAAGMTSFEVQFWDEKGDPISGNLENMDSLPRQASVSLGWPGAAGGYRCAVRVFMPANSELADTSNEDSGGE